jgi:hypothetical protein
LNRALFSEFAVPMFFVLFRHGVRRSHASSGYMEVKMKDKKKNFDNKIILMSVLIGIIIIIIDTFMDSYFTNNYFFQELFKPNLYEIIERGMFLFLSILIGVYASILLTKLRNTKEEIKTLEGILPICASCKKIREKDGSWQRIEKYIHDNSEADFSHGICPECREKLYGDDLRIQPFNAKEMDHE